MKKLPAHGPCFVCGSEDEPEMGVIWYVLEDGSIFSQAMFNHVQKGHPGFGQGGASAALLDEAMGMAILLAGYRVAPVNLNINYHKPVLFGQSFAVMAQVKEAYGKKITASGEIRLLNGTLAVSGEGIFVQAPQWFQVVEAGVGITPSTERKSWSEEMSGEEKIFWRLN
ncbi:MAG: PaaI family thioesterase [Anaerolineaceae bacterium]|jgi:acyl-coenzyme A thioesterase PaaI-like protein|nr:MAG: PaaI family thioesterase [Anaerolineaceae bacterium]